jgi:hypothetical protein
MRNNFEPVHLQKANELLSKQLRSVEITAENHKKMQKKSVKRLTIWEKFLLLSKLKSK